MIAAIILALALAQSTKEGKSDTAQRGSAPTPADRGSTAESSQRGSIGSTAGGEERTSVPGAGIESGDANGMAGGRTDEGPGGGTGIRNSTTPQAERARANANDQARGKNKRGEFLRPADSPPQMNVNPKPIGSGAPQIPPDQQPQARGKRYGRTPSHGRAKGKDKDAGGAAAQGSAGKGKHLK
ncbi:MAG: hypothetical protein ABR567_20435 [Myxococcales bacterium]|nr:hypothetical protein [Myxococcales bacterium]